MKRALAAVMVLGTFAVPPAAAQKKPAGVTYDVTINVDGGTYTGTMVLAVAAGKVTGDMNLTKPAEITGKAAGTSKAGKFNLDFPYRMVQRGCDGRIAVAIPVPVKTAPSKGTVEITGCGRPDANKLAGTIEMKRQ